MLSLHIAASVGWIGAVAAYLALDLTVASSPAPEDVQSAWFAMDLIVNKVIMPLALVALATGIIQSLGTKWGLFEHWWVLISLVLTILATLVLLSEAATVSQLAEMVAGGQKPGESHGLPGNTLLHSVGGLIVLLVVTVLNVFKPRGLTPYGWRKQQESD
jgi:hypothetical protein